MGILGQGINNTTQTVIHKPIADDRAMGNQRELMGLANRYAMDLTNHNAYANYKLWEATGLPTQARLAKEAGMSIGLLYGKGGGGGVTGISGSSANTPSAPMSSGSGAPNAMGLATVGSEVALNEALADKAKAEADKIRGADTKNTEASTALTNANAAFREIEVEIAKDTQVDKTIQIEAESRKAVGEMESAEARGEIDKETVQTEIEMVKTRAVGLQLQNDLTRAGINVSKKQLEVMAAEISKISIENVATLDNSRTNTERLTFEQKKQRIEQILAEKRMTQDEINTTVTAVLGILGISAYAGKGKTTTEKWGKHGEFKGATIQKKE